MQQCALCLSVCLSIPIESVPHLTPATDRHQPPHPPLINIHLPPPSPRPSPLPFPPPSQLHPEDELIISRPTNVSSAHYKPLRANLTVPQLEALANPNIGCLGRQLPHCRRGGPGGWGEGVISRFEGP